VPNNDFVGIGLVGCGSFGLFCLDAYSSMTRVKIVAVSDLRKDLADYAASQYNVPAFYKAQELMSHDDVDLVHIATPPSTHHLLAIQASRHGKHCLCEKPLALNTAQADEILDLARQAGTIAPVNFVMRYNAITEMAKSVINSGALGRVLRAQLTNCASDSNLPSSHWFWDKSTSGGIFIEHGVHFFDLYDYWLGEGKVACADELSREGKGMQDRVTCQVLHEQGTLASHYHGFDQPAELDRTDHRLICEMGEVVVKGWVPMEIRVTALVDEEGQAQLARHLDDPQVEILQEVQPGGSNKVFSRGKPRHYTTLVEFSHRLNEEKPAVYASSIRQLLADQIHYLDDPAHERKVTDLNGYKALALAESADNIASAVDKRAA